jgi:hypothetical protein
MRPLGLVFSVNHQVGPWIPRETFEQGSHDGESFPLKLTVAAPALAKLRCPLGEPVDRLPGHLLQFRGPSCPYSSRGSPISLPVDLCIR